MAQLFVVAGKNLPPKLPAEVNDAWLQTLPLVKPLAESSLYQGRSLSTIIKQFKTKINQGEAAEEYKVIFYDYRCI